MIFLVIPTPKRASTIKPYFLIFKLPNNLGFIFNLLKALVVFFDNSFLLYGTKIVIFQPLSFNILAAISPSPPFPPFPQMNNISFL